MSSFRFRKKTEYGLMMMTMLVAAGRGTTVSVAKMQKSGLPRSFLVKIARDLIKAGLIAAKEGRGGGYRLLGNPQKISLRKVVEAIEGKLATTGCLVHGARPCPLAKTCPHRRMMGAITEKIEKILDEYSLDEMGRK
ncbi:TPA: hypothetical protein DD448_03650 [Candidatus Collierbacteria bacterium]|uniref:Rrf2 family transcriptional regulator n=2 Tax=Candidatus Collieribacteriota TaxID=1752725 RepID=A0A1F5F453_9BACT|nr:MAG: Transcriptional regulator, BadM/Rrf2 family [Microgenomates group bacterium GW2011_GWF1_46_12]KKU44941.1 MAG: Transcriptional regulator, BadM/Rrf2 family [Microgenomates group bacterium GW2011_GWB1_46_7]KKU60816.1 MAG: Transcriptional regulator, BadM/Rrf2 family [Microgenomates group bacterium GW2011_GWE1_47_12]KKU62773.1 MAG: Transcriptional regulator, BadM/Rrf2 family [Microgenomates group bacterium GW2011_GWD1_47_13]OGD70949.1 MAG: hypothetical protein A2187_02815 [Candidatus Collier